VLSGNSILVSSYTKWVMKYEVSIALNVKSSYLDLHTAFIIMLTDIIILMKISISLLDTLLVEWRMKLSGKKPERRVH